jgi:ABC-2 type transport system permease protein
MSAIAHAGRDGQAEPRTLARPAGFWSDLSGITARSVRALLRQPEAIIPAVLIPLFFFVVNVGALGDIAGRAFGINSYAAFQLPVAMLFAGASTSAGNALVLDITGGYWDKLTLTPVRRSALVAGTLLAEMVAVVGYSVALIAFGMAVGVRFVGNDLISAVTLLVLTLLFALGFSAISVAVALATGSIRATQSTFLLFFPLLFLTPSAVPKELMIGWFEAAVSANPITYVLEASRALLLDFDAVVLIRGFLVCLLFTVFTFTLTALAFRRRLRNG